MLEALLQSQFDLYYKNLLRLLVSMQTNEFTVKNEADLYYKYVYQQNILSFYTYYTESFTLILEPLTKLADTYTPLFTQKYVLSRTNLLAIVEYYNSSASFVSETFEYSYTSNGIEWKIPFVSQYINVYKIDNTTIDNIILIKVNYDVHYINYTILTNDVVFTRLADNVVFDAVIVPITVNNVLNLIYTTNFNLASIASTDIVSTSMPINIIYAKNYERVKKRIDYTTINKSKLIQFPYIFIPAAVVFDLNYTNDNNIVFDIEVASYYPITYSDAYSFYLVGYEKKQLIDRTVLNTRYALIEPDITKLKVYNATLDITKPLYIYKQNIVYVDYLQYT